MSKPEEPLSTAGVEQRVRADASEKENRVATLQDVAGKIAVEDDRP